MSDVLANLPPAKVAAFYARLADAVDANKGALDVSLAALFMRQWLANRDPKATFKYDAPQHLKTYPPLRETLQYHRKVFLTEEKARVSAHTTKWAGIVPRLQGKSYPKWDGRTPLPLEYQSLVEIPIIRTQLAGSDADKDLLYALHGFQVKSYVSVAGAAGSKGRVKILFQRWECEVSDEYHWDPKEHLTVPNPDYQSKSPDAVTPSDRTVKVYHSNAVRLEQAGLAAPYFSLSNRFSVMDAQLSSPAEVDPSRSL
jgi:hypothetical protein